MTIAICLKVGDGVVFGADSASTIGSEGGVYNVYNNAEKIFNLRKGLSVGATSYGLGGLAGRSVTSLARDLRKRLQPGGMWEIDPAGYTIEEVAGRVRAFFYDELYVPEFEEAPEYDAMGFLVAGFSAGEEAPEVWEVEIGYDGGCEGPDLLLTTDEAGFIVWRGDPEALNRLLYGYSEDTWGRVIQAGLEPDDALALLASFTPLAHPAMPIQDAIDLVHYLAQVTAGYARFRPGAPTVSEPIDLAAITLHERFRWARRKHYYSPEFNPTSVLHPEKPDPAGPGSGKKGT